MRRAVLVLLATLIASTAHAGLTVKGVQAQITPPVKVKDDFKPVLIPNLVIDAFGWAGEFCGLYGCQAASEIQQDLKINRATCALNIYVRNTGGAATGPFSVKVTYYHWNGTVLLQKDIMVGGGLAAGASKVLSIQPNAIGYYHTGKPFTVTVDSLNQVTESDETDNTKTMPNP